MIEFPRQSILQSLCILLQGVSGNIFASTRPIATDSKMSDFVLLRLPQAIYDRGDTYQTTTAQIVVFARDLAGQEDTIRLEKMQQAVAKLFPIVTDFYHAKKPMLLNGGSDGAGFHSLIIQFSITILK